MRDPANAILPVSSANVKKETKCQYMTKSNNLNLYPHFLAFSLKSKFLFYRFSTIMRFSTKNLLKSVINLLDLKAFKIIFKDGIFTLNI
jgi:hypothetical protein